MTTGSMRCGRLAIVLLAAVASLSPDPRHAVAAPVQVAQAAIDPRVVGTWVNQTVNQQGGTVRWIWEIAPDGAYRFRSEGAGGPPAHAGRGAFAEGQWSLQATSGQPGHTDSGSYQVVGSDHVFFVGRLGPGTWQRMAGAPAATAAAWPARLPEMAARARAMARARLPDAILYELDLARSAPGAPAGTPPYEHRFFFRSPADQSTLSVMPFNPAGEVWPGGRHDLANRPALPDRFLDFPEAERRAQLLGMRGSAERAVLAEHDTLAWPTWTLWPVAATRVFKINGSAGVPLVRAEPQALADALAQATNHLGELVHGRGAAGAAFGRRPGPEEAAAGMIGRAMISVDRVGRSAQAGVLVYRDRAAAARHHEDILSRGGQMRFSFPRRWSDAGIGPVEARCLVGFTARQVLFARCAWLHPSEPAIATGFVELQPKEAITEQQDMAPAIDQAAFPLTMAAAFFLTDLLQAR
jgi:hypothetical protein